MTELEKYLENYKGKIDEIINSNEQIGKLQKLKNNYSSIFAMMYQMHVIDELKKDFDIIHFYQRPNIYTKELTASYSIVFKINDTNVVEYVISVANFNGMISCYINGVYNADEYKLLVNNFITRSELHKNDLIEYNKVKLISDSQTIKILKRKLKDHIKLVKKYITSDVKYSVYVSKHLTDSRYNPNYIISFKLFTVKKNDETIGIFATEGYLKFLNEYKENRQGYTPTVIVKDDMPIVKSYISALKRLNIKKEECVVKHDDMYTMVNYYTKTSI